jgi:hypothetical protein
MKSPQSLVGSPVCLVHSSAGAPIETHGVEWQTPCFADETGAVTWLFESIGNVQIDDVLGYSVASFTALPNEPELPTESNGLTWGVLASTVALKPLPTVLKDEIAYLSSPA